MESSEHKTDADKLNQLVNSYRGMIIQHACLIEGYFDMVISMYFSPGSGKKQQEFVDIILGGNRISFDGKRKIFDVILKKVKKDFKTEYPNFSTDMNTVLYERNSFAHCLVDTSPEALKRDNEFGLIKHSANTRTDYYDVNRLSEMTKAFTRVVKTMDKLYYEMPTLLNLGRFLKNNPRVT